jgi:outer membrane protein assembly factor BamB
MTTGKSHQLAICIFAGLVLLGSAALAADWPTYRHDNARTGSTSESLAAPLALDWVYVPLYPPRPAWPRPAERPREGFELRHRVIFDDAFQVAAVGDLVYFGSSADNKVYALDAATGRQRWSFFTGGPVRLAPTISDNRVLVGSDDGFVYCLKAGDGKLLWKVRGGPNGEKLLGHGKMISRWPIRTGVLVDEGIAYFGAGIFPHEDVFLHAVRVSDGSPVWKNDTISQQSANRDDLTPQGYLLAAKDRLFVPSGRALPVAFDRTNGRLAFKSGYGWRGEAAGGVVGGTYALLADDQIYTGTQNHLLALDQRTGRTGFAWFPGRRLAVAGDMAFLATGRELVAMDRTAYAKASGRRNSLEYRIKSLTSQVRSAPVGKREKLEQELKTSREELDRHRKDKIAPTVPWRVRSDCDAELILSGNMVIAGGKNKVSVFNRNTGQMVWSTKVDGLARGLALANGRLYVSTDKGRVYCFASVKIAKERNPLVRPVVDPYPKDNLTSAYQAAAEAIVMETGVKKGYCLVLGAEHGRLARELALRTELTVIAVESDPEKALAARLALDAAGLYGERVIIEQGDISKLPYSNYFANLIVSDSLLVTGKIPGDAGVLARHVKPWGGSICLGVPANAPAQARAVTSEKLAGWLAGSQLGQCRISQTNGVWATLKRGALSGAGSWTHQYAEPGNTACSDDQLLGGPLGLLWFGAPGPAPMVNRHNAAAAPLAVNGKLFIQGENNVMAHDSYNGMELWKREIPGAMRTRLKNSECGNLAASQDSIFVAVGGKCLRLDAETGETRATYNAPAGSKWGYLAYVDGILYGSTLTATGVSGCVFAIDTQDGKTLWTCQGKNIINLTIALGDGWLFFVDSSLSPDERQALLKLDKSFLRTLSSEQAKKAEQEQKKLDVRRVVALDARTGGKLWSQAVDVTDCSGIGIGGGQLTLMYRQGVVVLCGANANGHYWRQFLAGEFSDRRLVALSAKSGELLWARDADYRHRPVIVGDRVIAEPWGYDLKTGRQLTRRHPVSGAETVWQFFRPGHHCGAISACPQMLLMRSGDTSYYDLIDDSGIRHFSGQRLGCWINAIAADGLALMPEASAGCICLHPIICSLALEPRADHERWGIYSAGPTSLPVKRLAVNLGAPGDRRASDGEMWFGYPRPGLPADREAMGFSFRLQTEFFEGGGYFRQNSETEPVTGAEDSWVFSSCGRGLKRCTVPVLGEDDKPADYTVRLYFAELEDGQGGRRVFDVRLQGKTVLAGFDLLKEAGGPHKAVVKEFPGIRVTRNLEIELVPSNNGTAQASHMPILSGVEILSTVSLVRR